MSQTLSMFFLKKHRKMLGICWFCLVFLKFYVVKNTSTDIFLCPKLFLPLKKHRKSLEHRKFLSHSQILKNQGTFFYVNIFRWTQLKYPSFGGVFCAVQGLAWVPGVPDICGISGHHLWQPQIFEVLCANWHLQALFYRTDRTCSFKFLTQALALVLKYWII